LWSISAHAHGHSADTFVKMTLLGKLYWFTMGDSEIEEIIWLSYSDKDKISRGDKLIFFDFLKKYARVNITVCLLF
jgi:hypothetical protein